MKTLKRIIVALIICLTITTAIPTELINTTLTVEAHSGRTDRYGGHKDNKNKSGLGYYHYHCGGYPAHLHENGICPYANTNVVVIPDTPNNITTSKSATSNSNNIQSSETIITSNNTTSSSQSITISDTSYDNIAFNASYYANKHKDVYNTCGDNAKALYDHFINSGMAEGRQSSEQFNISVYKANNQDLIDAFGDDFMKYYNHFIEYGYNENRVSK